MQTRKLIIDGFEYPNIELIDNPDQQTYRISIMLIKGDQGKIIARTKPIKKEFFPENLLEYKDKFLIMECFKKIRCKICNNKSSVILMSQTEIGIICKHCLMQAEPQLEFKPVENLEKYINEK